LVPTKRAWPSTDRIDRDKARSIPGHKLARHDAAVIGNSHGASFRAAKLCRGVVHA
jgi:hypothetical protein